MNNLCFLALTSKLFFLIFFDIRYVKKQPFEDLSKRQEGHTAHRSESEALQMVEAALELYARACGWGWMEEWNHAGTMGYTPWIPMGWFSHEKHGETWWFEAIQNRDLKNDINGKGVSENEEIPLWQV